MPLDTTDTGGCFKSRGFQSHISTRYLVRDVPVLLSEMWHGTAWCKGQWCCETLSLNECWIKSPHGCQDCEEIGVIFMGGWDKYLEQSWYARNVKSRCLNVENASTSPRENQSRGIGKSKLHFYFVFCLGIIFYKSMKSTIDVVVIHINLVTYISRFHHWSERN